MRGIVQRRGTVPLLRNIAIVLFVSAVGLWLRPQIDGLPFFRITAIEGHILGFGCGLLALGAWLTKRPF
jgi:membrane associated rhomboid family serine protease